jgi:hypothetical protein
VIDGAIGTLEIREGPAQQHPRIWQNMNDAVASVQPNDGEEVEDQLDCQSMQIGPHYEDRDEVVRALEICFTRLHPRTSQAIATAWISAICPGKKLKFPYVSRDPEVEERRKFRHHDDSPRVPTFWPDITLCRHDQPGRIRKTGRSIPVAKRHDLADSSQSEFTFWCIFSDYSGMNKIGSPVMAVAQCFPWDSRTMIGLVF